MVGQGRAVFNSRGVFDFCESQFSFFAYDAQYVTSFLIAQRLEN